MSWNLLPARAPRASTCPRRRPVLAKEEAAAERRDAAGARTRWESGRWRASACACGDHRARPGCRCRFERVVPQVEPKVRATAGSERWHPVHVREGPSFATAIGRAYRRGARFRLSRFRAVPSRCVRRRLVLDTGLVDPHVGVARESTAALWVPRRLGDDRRPDAIPEAERDDFLERSYPRDGILAPRALASPRSRRRATRAAASGRRQRGRP